MFTVRCAANVLSQVTIICFSKIEFKESAFFKISTEIVDVNSPKTGFHCSKLKRVMSCYFLVFFKKVKTLFASIEFQK